MRVWDKISGQEEEYLFDSFLIEDCTDKMADFEEK